MEYPDCVDTSTMQLSPIRLRMYYGKGVREEPEDQLCNSLFNKRQEDCAHEIPTI